MSKDLGNNVRVKESIPPASISATTNGSVVPLAGFDAACVAIQAGAMTTIDGSNYFTMKAQVGDEADGSDMADAEMYAAKDGDGTAWDRKLDAAGNADKSYSIGFKTAGKKYGRAVAAETGTAVAVVGASIILGSPAHAPA